VVADGHAVVAQFVHELGCSGTLIVSVKQRTLELVTAIHKDRVVRARASVSHRCDQSRGTAKAIACGVVFGRATAVKTANRLKTSMKVIGV
jgi:hypothetical protein